MRSTKPGIPARVSGRSFSSLYAGMTTATRLPSSTRLRLDGRSAGEARGRLPEERGEDAEQEADDPADEDGVPAAAGGGLGGASRRDQLALLDGLRQCQQLLVLRVVRGHLPLLLG